MIETLSGFRAPYGRCSGEVDISRCRSSAHPWASTPSRFRPRSTRFALTWLEFRYSHLGFDRVGNETILVCGLVHFVELFCAGCSISTPGNLRASSTLNGGKASNERPSSKDRRLHRRQSQPALLSLGGARAGVSLKPVQQFGCPFRFLVLCFEHAG